MKKRILSVMLLLGAGGILLLVQSGLVGAGRPEPGLLTGMGLGLVALANGCRK